MAEPNTPGQIDIRLVGQSELTSLQTAIKEMASSVTTFSQGTAELRNVAERQMASQMGEQLRQIPQPGGAILFETAPGARSQGASTPFGGGTETPTDEYEPTTGRETFEQLADDQEARRKLAEGEIFEPQGAWQQWLARSLPDDYEAQVAQAKAGQIGPSGGASRGGVPPSGIDFGVGGMPAAGAASDIDPNAAIWQHQANELGLGGRISMPQYGDWTAQNKVFMAAQGLNWVANQQSKDAAIIGGTGSGQFLGQTAATIGRVSTYMPAASLIGGQLMGQADAPGLLGINARPAQLLRQYEEAGVAGGGGTIQDVPVIGEPFRQAGWNFDLPAPIRMLMTDAGQEALKDWPKRFQERRKHAGFTGDDETALQNFMASSGVLGRDQDYEDMYRGRAAQLLSRDWGLENISAETRVEMFGRVARQQGLGNASLDDFEESIRGVDEAAKAAHISGQEFADQLVQLQEHFETIGGTATSGLEAGRAFSSATGAMPGTMQAALQNPLVQANISLRSGGILPQAIGTLPAGQLTQGIVQTARMIRGNFGGIRAQDQEVRDPATGEVVGVNRISARSQRDAITANMMGIPLSEYRTIMRNARRTERVTPIQSAIEGWRQGIKQTEPGSPERRALLRDTTDPRIISGRDIVGMMEHSNIGTREQRGHLRELMNDDPGAARRMAQKMLDKYVGAKRMREEGRGNIEVDLSDRAARYLEIRDKDEKKSKRAANRAKQNKGAAPDYLGSEPDFPAKPGSGGWQTADFRSGTHSRPSDFSRPGG